MKAREMRVANGGPVLQPEGRICMTSAMASSNRERITKPQARAKGSGAFGRFEVTNDVSPYTKAAVFQPATTTRLVIRLSTVSGERASPDMWRDPRGFAIKFHTTEGNYDLVGNDAPVFIVKDPIHFQNFIRSQKRLASVNLRSNDMQWDFWTLLPETAHQVIWLMGDRGFPKTWRHMNLYSSRTHLWINAHGERFWVKYHFITDQGIEFWTQAEGDRLARADPDYQTRDLFEAIERGEHPSWTLKMQTMPFEEAKSYRFNPFDRTKVWPHGDYPLHKVGKLTLDRNPGDDHTEIEQAAFRTNNLVPGIGLSPDRMLLARTFPYADAHRARLGVNYEQIPVNARAALVHKLVRAAHVKHAEDDDWSQPGTLVREVLDDAARGRLVSNIVGILLNGVTAPVLERAFWYLSNVDRNLGERVEKGVRDGQRQS